MTFPSLSYYRFSWPGAKIKDSCAASECSFYEHHSGPGLEALAPSALQMNWCAAASQVGEKPGTQAGRQAQSLPAAASQTLEDRILGRGRETAGELPLFGPLPSTPK